MKIEIQGRDVIQATEELSSENRSLLLLDATAEQIQEILEGEKHQ